MPNSSNDTVAAPRWIAGPPSAADAPLRLFCFAHAGGGTSCYRPWRAALGPAIDTAPVLLPGRETRIRETPYRRMEELIPALCAALEPQLDRPYALFGHSMGAIVAFETARWFSARGAGPTCLIVSGRLAPRVDNPRRRFCGLPDEQFLAALAALGGTPSAVLAEPQLLKMLMPALRADFELNETYRPAAGWRLTCPVVAYLGADDPEVEPAEALRWREETTAAFTLRVFPGGHFYLADRPEITDAIRQDLRLADLGENQGRPAANARS